jgi:hypothetical protein
VFSVDYTPVVMKLLPFLAVTLLPTVHLAYAQTPPAWIEQQYNASLIMLLDNIFANGTVIASPSRNEPDYFVTVTRPQPS